MAQEKELKLELSGGEIHFRRHLTISRRCALEMARTIFRNSNNNKEDDPCILSIEVDEETFQDIASSVFRIVCKGGLFPF